MVFCLSNKKVTETKIFMLICLQKKTDDWKGFGLSRTYSYFLLQSKTLKSLSYFDKLLSLIRCDCVPTVLTNSGIKAGLAQDWEKVICAPDLAPWNDRKWTVFLTLRKQVQDISVCHAFLS